MEQGDCIPLNSDALDIATQEMPPIKKQATLPTKVADYLQDNCRIGFLRSHYQGVRYVELHTNEIFTALVELYSTLLHSLWHRFRRFSDAFATPANMTAQVFLARNLVSAWFHDCYVTIRSAGMKLSPIAFVENFEHEEIAYSEEYDNFLSTLNAHLRATPIHATPEDSLYIPILATDIDWNSPNPFRITNYTCDTTLVRGLIGLMKEMKLWNVTTLPANTIGRPFWLFDWHTEGRCCAWFPTDGNYSMEDVSLAYIIGVACTPKLGPRDVDDWQQFENNIVPANIDVFSLERVVDRRFFGGYEVRTIERRTEEIHPSQMPELAIVQTDGAQRGKGKGRVGTSKQSRISQAEPTGDGQGQEAPTMVGSYQFCIIDWTYYNLVVLNKDPHTRSGAMQMLALN